MSAPIQLQRLPSRKKPAPQRALLFLALLIVLLCLGLTGCSAEAASEQPLTRAEIAAQKACGRGYVMVWVDQSTVECMREIR